MKKKKELNDKSWKVLSEEDHKKLEKAQEKFLNDNKSFFEFLEKFPAKNFQDCIDKYCVQSYFEFLQNYDAKLFKRLWNSNEAIVENFKNKNDFDGMNPEGLDTIKKIIGENIDKWTPCK